MPVRYSSALICFKRLFGGYLSVELEEDFIRFLYHEHVFPPPHVTMRVVELARVETTSLIYTVMLKGFISHLSKKDIRSGLASYT